MNNNIIHPVIQDDDFTANSKLTSRATLRVCRAAAAPPVWAWLEGILFYMSYFHQIVFAFLTSALEATAATEEWRQQNIPKQTQYSPKYEEPGLYLSLLNNETKQGGGGHSFKMRYVITCICCKITYEQNLAAISPSWEVSKHQLWAWRSNVSHIMMFIPPSSMYSWAAAISTSSNVFWPFFSLLASHL